MRIKLAVGTILESSNPLVIEQWKKLGYKNLEEKKEEKQRRPRRTRQEGE